MRSVLRRILLAAIAAGGSLVVVAAQNGSDYFQAGNLLVSRSIYLNQTVSLQPGDALPPDCLPANCAPAVSDSTYPFVWNNDTADGSFGITSKILLDQITPSGALVNTLEVPNSTQRGVPPTKDQLVTSFSSKSELALNLSTDGEAVTFMGYVAPVGALDVSNSNTPLVIDPTNPVPGTYYRAVAQVDQHGQFRFTETNAYSGNNGRAAVLNNTNGNNLLYLAGNAGNGGNPQPDGIIVGAGAQVLNPEVRSLVAQNPGTPTPVASFSIEQLGDTPDKIGKDTNFRGLRIFNNVLYYTKGSGGNGVNTLYFVDTTGQACPTGVGLAPEFGALPVSALSYDPSVLQTAGLTPTNMCILKGFPTALKTKTSFPFGIWFADANTVYVADEGDGDSTYSAASGTYTNATVNPSTQQTLKKVHPGLQKWTFDGTTRTWMLRYTIQAGLNLGVPYTVAGYPTGTNAATGLPWAPATGGLRNITGRVNPDGTVTVWAITSTVSGNGDQGADPNELVAVTDPLASTALPSGEAFTIVRQAGFGEVLRGVSFTPGTGAGRQ